jgi:hypothetical protein
MPMKKLLSESETFAAEVDRSFAIAGNPGRYMSIEKGVSAVRLPRISISETYLGFDMAMTFIVSGSNRDLKWMQITV